MLKRFDKHLALALLVIALGAAYVAAYRPSEPFFNNDETRHVMTGVYFRDLLRDLPLTHLRDYTINYYLQYPALGLLVWPPFFYFLEGVSMSIFGTSIIVPKALVGLFAVTACAYLFRLACRTHGAGVAAVAILFFGLSPLVFELAHYVMLEVPTLALALAATFHFVSYLEAERRRDLRLAALFSALAALTRFDAVYLLPLFLLLLAQSRRWKILWRREVLTAAALALLLIAPFYALSTSGIGWAHFKFVTEPLTPNDPGFLTLRRLLFYPSRLPSQLGWPALVPALVGLGCAVGAAARRRRAGLYLSMAVATYLTFTPMGELGSRHAIYWVPAFAVFAAEGLAIIAKSLRAPQLYLPLAACALAATLLSTLASPLRWVRGYEEAAREVSARPTDSPFCLFIGGLNGDFIYQLRRRDPSRQFWVLRADKLLFSVLEIPGTEYRELEEGDEAILGAIFRYDPEFIVMEAPAADGANGAVAGEELRGVFERRVRDVIGGHPERFTLERVIAVDSNEPRFRRMALKVFRNRYRNENPERRLWIDVLMLRRSLQTEVP